MLKWVALHTKSKRERQVEDALRAKGVETFLPVFHKYTKHRRRMEARPFFPGYMFARVDPSSPELQSLNWTPGLRNVAEFEGEIAWVPDEVVLRIDEFVKEWDVENYPQEQDRGSSPKRTDRVQLKTDIVDDLKALLDKAPSPAQRVTVLLNILARLNASQT